MKLTKRYAFLVIGNVGNFQMAQETASQFLRILRGLLFPHIVPRFPTTSDYSVAYSTTLLLCISLYWVLKRQKSCARHKIRDWIMKRLIVVLLCVIALFAPTKSSNGQVPSTPLEKQKAFLTPAYYTNWIGADFLTIPTIEAEMDVEPMQIIGLIFYYDFSQCIVGMEANEQGVVIGMNFRLFGNDALKFISDAVDYGYVKYEKGKDVVVRANSSELLPNLYTANVTVYRKKTDHGYMMLEVSSSQEYANEYMISIYRKN